MLHIRFRLCTSRCTYLARVPKTCQQQRKDSLNNFIRSRFFFFSFKFKRKFVDMGAASSPVDGKMFVLYRSQSRDLNHFPITRTPFGMMLPMKFNFAHDIIINLKWKDFVLFRTLQLCLEARESRRYCCASHPALHINNDDLSKSFETSCTISVVNIVSQMVFSLLKRINKY